MISLSSNSSAKPSKLKTSTIPTAGAPPLCSRKKTGSNRSPKRHDHSSFVAIPLILYLYLLHIIQKLHLKYRRAPTSRPYRMVTYPTNTHIQFLWAAITLLVVSMFMQIYTRMHSSRMRTGRSLTVCCSVLPGGGVLLGPGGGCAWSRGRRRGEGWFLLGPGGWVCAWSGGGSFLVWGRGVCAWSWGAVPGPGGGLLGPGGFLLGPGGGVCLVLGGVFLLGPGGVCLVPGGSPWSRGVLRRPPPVNRITDTCKNITLATTSLRPVIK